MLFFFRDPATTEIYTLSLHDALPIYLPGRPAAGGGAAGGGGRHGSRRQPHWQRRVGRGRGLSAVGRADRKSTRLNSSHTVISYAVFCLKKKITTRCEGWRSDAAIQVD